MLKKPQKKNSDRQYKKERVETENGNGIETLAKRRGFFVLPFFSPVLANKIQIKTWWSNASVSFNKHVNYGSFGKLVTC